MSPVKDTAAAGLRPSLTELQAVRETLSPGRKVVPGAGSGQLAGAHRRRVHGQGLEPTDSRPYVPGDEARHVDWRVSARAGQLYSRRFEAERSKVCLLLADPQPRQWFGSRLRLKSVQVARAAAAAAWWALAQGDRVGALNIQDDTLVTPKMGLGGVMPVLQALERWYAQPPVVAREVDLADSLQQALRLARGGTLVVLADAVRVATVPADVWAMLCQHLSVHLVLVKDVLEEDPPHARLAVEDANGMRWLDLGQTAVRSAWCAPLRQAKEAISRWALPSLQVHWLLTDDDAAGWLPLQRDGSSA